MAVDLAQLAVDIALQGADTTISALGKIRENLVGTEQSAGRAESATKQFQRSLQDMHKSALDLHGGLRGLMDTLRSFTGSLAIGEVIKRSIDATRGWAGELERLQSVAGMSAKSAAGFGAAAMFAGV